MHQLNYELKNLAKQYPEGSYGTQAARRYILNLAANELYEAGWHKMSAKDLKGRHINALLQKWTTEGRSPGTIKNRLSILRWWAKKVGKREVMAANNSHYHVPSRQRVARVSKAVDLPADRLVKVRNEYVRMSLELQMVFGLRREESIKLKPHQADRGDHLALKGSWCKGGRPRTVPIRTVTQREVLERAKALVKDPAASLIPAHKRYVEHLYTYQGSCLRAGLHKMHGLRHGYAQARFLELAGFACPVAGGPTVDEMTDAQRRADLEAREIISEELGHARASITEAYLGSPTFAIRAARRIPARTAADD